MNEDVITAISTPIGTGGIGIVRMSGEDTFNVINKIFVPANKSSEIEGYKMKYGHIIDNFNNNKIVDEVLVTYFVSPKSYTRENMCEINTHGGIVIVKKILELCLKNGARMADPGEFTKRAFLNGRIDLSQAESVMDLINSKSEREEEEAINQLEGSLSKEINNIESKLLSTITAIEVTIDYPEYEIEEVEGRNIPDELSEISKLLEKLENSFEQGKLMKNGIKTIILGKPNVGKSSLLNSILKEDRAIVSEIEGTTRDTIEENVNVNGITLDLIDTAGIRNTENEIEKIGVEKAKKLADKAELIIAIFDISKDLDSEDEEILNIIKDKNSIIILNKVDITKENKNMEAKLKEYNKPIIKISAMNNEGIDDLYNEIEKMFNLNEIKSGNEIIITNERHKDKIKKANEYVLKAIDAIKQNTPIDICSIYIKQALNELDEIIGKNVSDNIINEIFKNFCLGK